jgi:L-cysteine:1D-myo-inositol 2-amino-2-deoxy-alpha-D-glucopyranoside ligase
VFPHHEMSGSHARVAAAAGPGEHVFARVYAHSGMVSYQGAKMSKSLGNLVFVSRLRAAGTDPMAIRLALLAHHYRADWEWTDEVLAQAQARLGRWRAAVAAAVPPTGATAADVLATVRARLADDLDAPGALDAVDAWADAALASAWSAGIVGQGGDPGDAALVRATADALLGVAL